MEFRYRRQVQFAETDLVGIVHFSYYFRYMEEAEHALWRAAGLSIERAGANTGWPRVAAAFEFRRPLQFEDEFDVCVRILTLSRRTIQYSFTVVRGTDDIGSGTMTSAHVQRAPDGSMRAVPIPADIVERLRATAGDAAPDAVSRDS